MRLTLDTLPLDRSANRVYDLQLVLAVPDPLRARAFLDRVACLVDLCLEDARA